MRNNLKEYVQNVRYNNIGEYINDRFKTEEELEELNSELTKKKGYEILKDIIGKENILRYRDCDDFVIDLGDIVVKDDSKDLSINIKGFLIKVDGVRLEGAVTAVMAHNISFIHPHISRLKNNIMEFRTFCLGGSVLQIAMATQEYKRTVASYIRFIFLVIDNVTKQETEEGSPFTNIEQVAKKSVDDFIRNNWDSLTLEYMMTIFFDENDNFKEDHKFIERKIDSADEVTNVLSRMVLPDQELKSLGIKKIKIYGDKTIADKVRDFFNEDFISTMRVIYEYLKTEIKYKYQTLTIEKLYTIIKNLSDKKKNKENFFVFQKIKIEDKIDITVFLNSIKVATLDVINRFEDIDISGQIGKRCDTPDFFKPEITFNRDGVYRIHVISGREDNTLVNRMYYDTIGIIHNDELYIDKDFVMSYEDTDKMITGLIKMANEMTDYNLRDIRVLKFEKQWLPL